MLFRLRGSTDEATDALRERIGQLLAGVRVRDLQRLAPEVLAGVLPRLYPQMLEIAYGHQDEGRPIFIFTAASQEMADLMALVLTFDGAVGSVSEVATGSTPGRAGGPFTYREGKARGDPRARRARGHRPGRVLGATRDWESDLPMLRPSAIPWSSTPTRRSRASRGRRAGRCCASTGSAGGCGSAGALAAAAVGGIGSRAGSGCAA